MNIIDNRCSCEEFDLLQQDVAILQGGLTTLENYHRDQRDFLLEELRNLQKQIDYLKLPWWKKLLSFK